MTRQISTEEIDADDELLTSYLDQELTPEERSQFERRLVDEEELRLRLAEMRRAWELLDDFPETPFNQHFTRSTLEMVALDIELDRGKVASIFGTKLDWLPKLSFNTLAVILACLAVIVGSLVGLAIRQRTLKNEAYQVAVASVLPLLQDFSDVESLQGLLDIPKWKELLGLQSIRDRILTDFPKGQDVDSIQQWTSRLDVNQKELLYNQKQGLDRMTLSERNKISKRYEELKSQPNVEELQSVAAAIYGVLQSLPMNTRAEIRSLPSSRKSRALREEACLMLALLHNEKLTQDEKTHLDKWAREDLVTQIKESPMLPTQFQDWRLESVLGWVAYSPYLNSQFTIDLFSDPDGLMESFYKGLSADTVRLFQGVAPQYQMMVVANWVLNKKPDSLKNPTEDEMYEKYKQMNNDTKDRIDMKRPEEAKKDMERSASRSRRPGQDGPGTGPGPGPGPGIGIGPGIGPGTGPGTGGGPGKRFGPNGPSGQGPGDMNRLDRPSAPFAGPPPLGPKPTLNEQPETSNPIPR